MQLHCQLVAILTRRLSFLVQHLLLCAFRLSPIYLLFPPHQKASSNKTIHRWLLSEENHIFDNKRSILIAIPTVTYLKMTILGAMLLLHPCFILSRINSNRTFEIWPGMCKACYYIVKNHLKEHLVNTAVRFASDKRAFSRSANSKLILKYVGDCVFDP